MRKLLILTVVLGMASMANAAMSLVVNGAEVGSEITIAPTDNIWIGVYDDTGGPQYPLAVIIAEDGGANETQGSWTGGNNYYSPPAVPGGSNFYVGYMSGYGDMWYLYNYDPCGNTGPGLQSDYEFHCDAAGDVVINLHDFFFAGGVIDTLTIYQGTSDMKWSQPPVVIDEGPPPTYFGWDEPSLYGFGPIVADDWLCQDQRPVSDIHWWGSYQYWEEPVPPIPPLAFHIGIWTDVPVGDPCNFYPYSHPGRMIWEYWAAMAEVNEEWVGYDMHPDVPFIDACFKYDLQLPQEAWFWQEGPGNIYWLSISAIYDVPPPEAFYWGWKTREHFYNDDAVRIWTPNAPTVGGPPFIEGQPILPGWDMAFELTTTCSNCGDFDHNGTIDLNDLRTLAANWLWTGTPGGNIANLNCDGKVDNEDFAIFALQWLDSCP